MGFHSDDGQVANGLEAIFPIFKHLPSGRAHLLGTGFFIAEQGIFATAKHVLMDAMDGEKNIAGISIVQFVGDKWYHRRIIRFTINDQADIAVGILEPVHHNVTGQPMPNKQLVLTRRLPDKSEPVGTYAMPESEVAQEELGRFSVDIRPKEYIGEIEEYYPRGRDSVMLPTVCFRTSIEIKSGASGGPVFDHRGHVFAVNSTGIDGTRISFVSSVLSLFPIWVSDVNFPNHAPGRNRVRVQEMADWGFVKCVG